jgi:hypothetical protein
MNIKKSILLTASVATLGAVACKQATNTKGKNTVAGVENLAQATDDTKPNNPICGATTASSNESLVAWMKGTDAAGKPLFANAEDGSAMAADDALMVAFAKTASSLPETVIKFLLATKTKVVFGPGEPDACKSTPDAALFSKFQKDPAPKYSCFQKIEGQSSPTIYFGEMSSDAMVKAKEYYGGNDGDWVGDVFVVRRDLVRNVAGIYARMIRLLARAAKEKASDASLSEAQRKAILAVSAEYDISIKNRGPLADAFMCDMHMIEGDQCKAGANFSDEAKARVKEIKASAGEELFGDYLVTEVFDSYYCNEKTKEAFQRNFNSTFSAFESSFVQVDFSAARK